LKQTNTQISQEMGFDEKALRELKARAKQQFSLWKRRLKRELSRRGRTIFPNHSMSAFLRLLRGLLRFARSASSEDGLDRAARRKRDWYS